MDYFGGRSASCLSIDASVASEIGLILSCWISHKESVRNRSLVAAFRASSGSSRVRIAFEAESSSNSPTAVFTEDAGPAGLRSVDCQSPHGLRTEPIGNFVSR